MPTEFEEAIRRQREENELFLDRCLMFGPPHDAPPPPPRLTDVPTEAGRYLTDMGLAEVRHIEEKGGLCTYESDSSGPGAWSGWFRIDDPRGPCADRVWGRRVLEVRYVTEDWRDEPT